MPRRWTVGEFEVVADDTPMAELCEDTFQQGGLSAAACTAGVVAGLRPVGAQALIHRRGAQDREISQRKNHHGFLCVSSAASASVRLCGETAWPV
jgi:hypothetical protein